MNRTLKLLVHAPSVAVNQLPAGESGKASTNWLISSTRPNGELATSVRARRNVTVDTRSYSDQVSVC